MASRWWATATARAEARRPEQARIRMFGADKGTADRLDGRKLVIGIVQARFNQGVTNALAKACWDELLARGVQEKNIEHVQVPGALEVPIALQAMAEKGGYDALIALGCIIRG